MRTYSSSVIDAEPCMIDAEPESSTEMRKIPFLPVAYRYFGFSPAKVIFERKGDGDLFKISDAPYFNPEKEPSLEPTVCEECDELVLEEFVKEQKGKKVCKNCMK